MGAANLACSVVGGYPVGASASRSAASLGGGGRTTLVSWVAAAIVALTLVLLAPYLADLPVPVLAGVVTAAAIRLLAISDIRALWPRHRAELAVALVAAAGVVLAGVLAGVVLALVLSLVDFLWRAASSDVAVLGRRPGRPGWYDARRFPVTTVPAFLVVRYSGAIFFANADAIRTRVLTLLDAAPGTEVLVLHLPGVAGVDVTGLEMLAGLLTELDRRGVVAVVSGATGPLRDALTDPVVAGRLAPDRIVKTVEEAMFVARPPTDRRVRTTRIARRQPPITDVPADDGAR
jgi:MFS superfamily sulfate permease-like transporter